MKLRLDTILAAILIISFILSYGLAPGSTPYLLFAAIFVGLITFSILDVANFHEALYEKLKNITLFTLIVVVILSAFGAEITLRHQSLPTFRVHDILLQQEAALRYLIDGKNPYSTSYFGTPLEQFVYGGGGINPALYHFVMEPLYLIAALPFYPISGRLLGFFDARIPLLFLFFSILFFIQRLNIDGEKKKSISNTYII